MRSKNTTLNFNGGLILQKTKHDEGKFEDDGKSYLDSSFIADGSIEDDD